MEAPKTASPEPILGGEVKPSVSPESWRSKLSEDLRDNPSLVKFKDESSLAKSYLELQKTLGSARLEKPSESWTPEQWDKFYNELGRPESADKYAYDEKQMPDGLIYDKGMEERFNKIFHKAGLTNKQAAIIRDEFVGYRGESHSQMVKAREERAFKESQNLKQEWGDEYDARMDAAFKTAREFGGQEMAKALADAGMGLDPSLLRAFSKIGMLMNGDKLRSGRGGSEFMMSRDEALTKLADLKGDEGFIKRFNSGDKEAIAQREKLFKLAYGS